MSALSWRACADLARDTLKLAPMLAGVDAIMGVPRSGMLPASILACHMHKPLGTVHFEHGERFFRCHHGSRLRSPPGDVIVAVVDDSVLTGSSMKVATGSLVAPTLARGVSGVIRACVYMQPGAESHVDHFAVVVPSPRVFEWNLFGSEIIRHSLIDIDGVLCPDPPMSEDDEGAYSDYIASAPVLYMPMHGVSGVVTNRLEKYREATICWLESNGIGFGSLRMAPFGSASARRRMSTPAALKSAWYSTHTAPGVLVESHDHIASEVASCTGRPVISIQSMRCFGG